MRDMNGRQLNAQRRRQTLIGAFTTEVQKIDFPGIGCNASNHRSPLRHQTGIDGAVPVVFQYNAHLADFKSVRTLNFQNKPRIGIATGSIVLKNKIAGAAQSGRIQEIEKNVVNGAAPARIGGAQKFERTASHPLMLDLQVGSDNVKLLA